MIADRSCIYCSYTASVNTDYPLAQNGLMQQFGRDTWVCSGPCKQRTPLWHNGTKPHGFQESVYDKACKCRMPRNYRSHQPFWWRWFNPGRQYRT